MKNMETINPLQTMQIDCPICGIVRRAVQVVDPINSIVRTKCTVCLAAWAYEIVPAYQIERAMSDIVRDKRKRRAKLERMKNENISNEKRNTDG